jgi:hypothetical protein
VLGNARQNKLDVEVQRRRNRYLMDRNGVCAMVGIRVDGQGRRDEVMETD